MIPEYKSIRGKKEFFRSCKKIDTEEEFEKIYKVLKKDSDEKKSIFRGVRESRFKIYNSFQRYNFINSKALNYKKYIEIAKCNQELKNYFHAINVEITEYSLSSFLQHYGNPSLYIDFTFNLDVAIYFMLDGVQVNDTNSEIENYMSLYKISNEDLSGIDIEEVLKSNDDYYNLAKETIANSCYDDKSFDLLAHVETMFEINTLDVFLIRDTYQKNWLTKINNNINISNQNGLFIYNRSDSSLEESLKTLYNFNPYPSDLDNQLTDEQIEQDRKNAERILKMKSLHSGNIIESIEINKKLVPLIRKKIQLTEQEIYPDPKFICKKIIDDSLL